MANELRDAQGDRSRWPLLRAEFDRIFQSRTRAEWQSLLQNGDACFAPVLSWQEASSHPQIQARKAFIEVDGVIHYCVANMPGAVARTSTIALNNATLPFALKLAGMGAADALAADRHLANGLNVSAGKIRHSAVAEALELPLN